PAARRQLERRLDLRAGGDGIGEVLHSRLDLSLFHSGPRPAFGRPEPVIIQWVGRSRSAEDSLIEFLDHCRVGRVLAQRLQPFLDQFGDDEWGFGADTRLDAYLMRKAEGVPEHPTAAVENFIAGLWRCGGGHEAEHDLRPEIITFEQRCAAENVITGFLRG